MNELLLEQQDRWITQKCVWAKEARHKEYMQKDSISLSVKIGKSIYANKSSNIGYIWVRDSNWKVIRGGLVTSDVVCLNVNGIFMGMFTLCKDLEHITWSFSGCMLHLSKS